MGEFLEKNKIFLAIIATALLGGFLFYWFEWRPSEIRKECYSSLQLSGGFVDEKGADGLPSLKMMPVSSDKADEFYRDCLRQHGLEK